VKNTGIFTSRKNFLSFSPGLGAGEGFELESKMIAQPLRRLWSALTGRTGQLDGVDGGEHIGPPQALNVGNNRRRLACLSDAGLGLFQRRWRPTVTADTHRANRGFRALAPRTKFAARQTYMRINNPNSNPTPTGATNMSTRTRLITLSLGLVCSFAASTLCAQAGDARFDKEHPRRSEVLDRLQNANARLNADKGNLDGHYYQLKQEEAAIHDQERFDKNMDGGHITLGEQARLNAEENRLNRQIKQDQ
jgi:hypothetical protein